MKRIGDKMKRIGDKMKRIIFFLLVVVLFGVVGCDLDSLMGNEEDEKDKTAGSTNNTEFVGSWKIDQSKSDTTDITIIKFNSDYSYTDNHKYYANSQNYTYSSSKGTYSINTSSEPKILTIVCTQTYEVCEDGRVYRGNNTNKMEIFYYKFEGNRMYLTEKSEFASKGWISTQFMTKEQ